MGILQQFISRAVRGRTTGRRPGPVGRPGPGAAGRAGGTRTQDEAIGRGVRTLLRRFGGGRRL